MSERRVLVDDTNERNGKASCPASRNNVLDGVSYFALGFVLAGLIFAAVGFLYPRDLVRDPNASARENEAVDIEYMQLTNALNAIVITGMVLIGVGGLILAAIFTNTVVCEECHSGERPDTETRTLTKEMTSYTAHTSSGEVTPSHDYGAVSAEPIQRETAR